MRLPDRCDLRPCVTAAFLLTGMLFAAPQRAQAQGFGGSNYDPNARQVPGPFSRPAVSPYLNLLRGNRVGLNYYGIVRPEIDFRSSEQRLQSDLLRLDERYNQLQSAGGLTGTPSQLRGSGHASQFMTDLHGRPENLSTEMQERRTSAAAQFRQTGRFTTNTGHQAYFGNAGGFYRAR